MPSAHAVGDLDTPVGEVVIGGGGATFDRPIAGQLNVNQSTDRVVINWNRFDIGKNATTNFIQPSSNALAVNRVVGGNTDPTKILGKLNANGKVMVIDRNGVFFGPNSQVNVGAIVAGAGDVSTSEIMGGAGKIRIDNVNPNAVIENQGKITVANAGVAAFVAPTMKNSGTITAKLGKVGFGAGQKVIVDMYGDGLISVALDSNLSKTLIENSGKISAEGGFVQMTARAAGDAVDNVINTSGIVDVSSATVKGGRIILSGDTDINVSGKLDAGSATQDAGSISIKGRDAKIDGSVYAESKGAKGGYIDIGALEHTTTVNGKIKSTGKTEGGVVKIFGGAAQINTPAVVDVSSSEGKGGRITVDMNSIVTPDTVGQVNVDGSLIANGKTDGGQIELSGTNTFFGSASQVVANGKTGIGGQISTDSVNSFNGFGYISAIGYTTGGHVSVHANDINLPGDVRSIGDNGAGGSVALRAQNIADISGTVNVKGVGRGGAASVTGTDIIVSNLINAESVGNGPGGSVRLLASNSATVDGKLKASGVDHGGQVKINSKDITIGETALLFATSTGSLRGGNVELLGYGDVNINGTLKASGVDGGGEIKVTGDNIFVGIPGYLASESINTETTSSIILQAALNATFNGQGKVEGKVGGGNFKIQAENVNVGGWISANSTSNGPGGNGGIVSLLGTVYNEFTGFISSRGGPGFGNGGTVVINTPNTVTGGVDVSAPNGTAGAFTH